MKTLACAVLSVLTLAFATATADAQIRVHTNVFKSKDTKSGVKYSPFKAKPGSSFLVVLRLYTDAAAQVPFVDDTAEPWLEELMFTLSQDPADVLDPIGGEYFEAGPIAGHLDVVFGASEPLPTGIGTAGLVFFTTQIVPIKKGVVGEPFAESRTQVLGDPGTTFEEAEILSYLSLVNLDDGLGNPVNRTIRISGVNVQIVNGSGDTTSVIDGRGNLIVGYNELRGTGDDRTGSHNLIVGTEHNYSSFGGVVAGRRNTISGGHASVSGGRYNEASGDNASVSGGSHNTASSLGASVSGGGNNTASGYNASISGGRHNSAYGYFTSVSGGQLNIASYGNALAAGGSVSGGRNNTASANSASVSGGRGNVASDRYSSVSGGQDNVASGRYSSVSGGKTRTASNYYNWVAGTLFEDS